MIVMVTVEKVIFWGFVVVVTVATEKVNKQRTICEKLVGIGSVMDNYVGCDSSCNSHNIG